MLIVTTSTVFVVSESAFESEVLQVCLHPGQSHRPDRQQTDYKVWRVRRSSSRRRSSPGLGSRSCRWSVQHDSVDSRPLPDHHVGHSHRSHAGSRRLGSRSVTSRDENVRVLLVCHQWHEFSGLMEARTLKAEDDRKTICVVHLQTLLSSFLVVLDFGSFIFIVTRTNARTLLSLHKHDLIHTSSKGL